MNSHLKSLMSQAMQLTRSGNLQAATAAIQAALGNQTQASPAANMPARSESDVIDVTAREVPGTGPESEASVPPRSESSTPAAGRFISGSHRDAAGSRDFKLYIPPTAGDKPLPLVVMLHGCTQNPDDFAAGTTMNEAARAQGFFVLYPQQSTQMNPQRCWNWFKHSHQTRGRGEPGLLAGMTREVMSQHAIDPDRVYVAGLSAGGAMAAILGESYPDLFAAVGVHSGLAAGMATDLPSALSAMKGGGSRTRAQASGMPTIVFHGDADNTVHPLNGEQVISASTGKAAHVEVQQVKSAGVRTATRSTHRAADGTVAAEHWLVHGSAHAWSGGSAQGSYTDSRGPDASAEMMRFFMEHPRRRAH
ncbi:MAG TPA: PHB depolymerase family esterase [Polaromonas sp.]|uniref:extracellular catalytic domain type 1 short-chain-length polyhydroxyalkanoate depolymerase n=1 Tax=Polaromonas sp. TaxID=1869339 RepID=UPI002D5602C1|nr:PHB depolymerase family esterase [Polaromonas sp.]HYW58766.1 PHB depolymerase family esterase [Polaromonas sp.]